LQCHRQSTDNAHKPDALRTEENIYHYATMRVFTSAVFTQSGLFCVLDPLEYREIKESSNFVFELAYSKIKKVNK